MGCGNSIDEKVSGPYSSYPIIKKALRPITE